MKNRTAGGLLKTYRKEKKLTQKQLALQINKSEITIRKYESGSKIPKNVFLQFCSIFNIAPITWISDIYDLNEQYEYRDLFLNDEYTLNHSPNEIYLSKKIKNDELSIGSLVAALIKSFANSYEVPWRSDTLDTVYDDVEWDKLIDSLYATIELFMVSREEKNYDINKLINIIEKNEMKLSDDDLFIVDGYKFILKGDESNGDKEE